MMNTINLDIFIILQYDTNRKVEMLYEIKLVTLNNYSIIMDSFGNLIIIKFKHGKCPFSIVLPASREFSRIKQYGSEQDLRSSSGVVKLSDSQRCGMLNLIPF